VSSLITFGSAVDPVRDVFTGPRPAPTHWQQRLESVVPRTDALSWLYLRWEPGDPWQPVNRWVIWQIRPLSVTRPEYVAAVKGPDPRSTGHACVTPHYVGKIACLCPVKREAWVGGSNRLIDRAQWEVYRETGGFGTRWWAIQGPPGGHRYRLDKWESKVSRIHGGPEDTPSLGDLPYQEFSELVVSKIIPYDNVRQWKHIMDYAHRNPGRLDEIEREGVLTAQAELWKWLESQVGKSVDGLTRGELNLLRDTARDHTPVGAHLDASPVDPDVIKHEFIHSASE
jgi:hypothetical protein